METTLVLPLTRISACIVGITVSVKFQQKQMTKRQHMYVLIVQFQLSKKNENYKYVHLEFGRNVATSSLNKTKSIPRNSFIVVSFAFTKMFACTSLYNVFIF